MLNESSINPNEPNDTNNNMEDAGIKNTNILIKD